VLLARASRPPMLGAVDGASVAALVATQLAPQLARSAAALGGPRARAAAEALRVAGFSRESLRAYTDVYAMCDGLATRWTAGAAAQRAWHGAAAAAAARARARDGHGDGDDDDDDDGDADGALAVTPAWQVLPLCAEEAPAEAMLVALRALLGAGQRMWAAERERTRAHARAAGAPVPHPVRVSQDEFADALRDGAAVAAGGALLLAQLRVAASLHEYAAACELLGAQLTSYAASVAAAMLARGAWSAEMLAGGIEAQGPSPASVGRFFTPSAAAG
jgi:hypothetical protein